MNIFSSPIFGDLPAPESFDELLQLARLKHPSEHRCVRMWRGQADVSWPVHSTAYRRISLEKKVVTEQGVSFYEQGLLKRAAHKDLHYVDGRALSDLELLARLQHHGAATRLVDASRNVLVALWFAVTSHSEQTGLLLGIHASFLGGYEGERNDEKYDDIFKGLANFNHPQTWEPSVVSRRIAAQHSQFLYSRISNEAAGSLELPKDKDASLFIAISPVLKNESKVALMETYDIHEATLFPDLDGFAHSNRYSLSRGESHRW